MAATVTAGTTAYGTWAAWTANQIGDVSDAGYTACPPAQWLTPQRAILKAGDTVGIIAKCPTVCGTLTVSVSLDNGTVLEITARTVETDEWGAAEAYWFVIPAGLSTGMHELRARITPSVAGMERVLQGVTGNDLSTWTDSLRIGQSSLCFASDPQDLYAVVASGGTATGTDGVAQVSVDGDIDTFSPTPYATIMAAALALSEAKAPSGDENSGGIIYVGEGNWNGRINYGFNNTYWITVKRHPAALKANTKISISNPTDETNSLTAWAKYQGFAMELQTDGVLIYASNNNRANWFDDCDVIGQGATTFGGSPGLVANGGWHFYSRFTTTDIYGGQVACGAVGFLREFETHNSSGDIFTNTCGGINGLITNHRAFEKVHGVTRNMHGDFLQVLGAGIDNMIISGVRAECSYAQDDPDPGDTQNGLEMFRRDGELNLGSNILLENVHVQGLNASSGIFGFLGPDPVGVMYHSVTCDTACGPLGFADVSASQYKGCEIVNCVFNDLSFDSGVIALLKSNGRYAGNHRIAGAGDASDTSGTPDWDLVTKIPTNGGNLSGRNRLSLRDADGNRRETLTAAGAYSALDERAPIPVFSLATGIYRTGRTVSITGGGQDVRTTIDGTDPGEASTVRASLVLAGDVTLKGRTYFEGSASPVVTAAYTVVTDGSAIPPSDQSVSVPQPAHL